MMKRFRALSIISIMLAVISAALLQSSIFYQIKYEQKRLPESKVLIYATVNNKQALVKHKNFRTKEYKFKRNASFEISFYAFWLSLLGFAILALLSNRLKC